VSHESRRHPHSSALGLESGISPDGRSGGLDATYHFTFTGEEDCTATVVIRDKTLQVQDGHQGTPDLHLIADSRTWIKFLMKEQNLIWAILRRRIRLKGPPRLLLAFGKCFPA